MKGTRVRKFAYYHDEIRSWQQEGLSPALICRLLNSAGVECQGPSVRYYLAKWPGGLPVAREIGLGRLQQSLGEVRLGPKGSDNGLLRVEAKRVIVIAKADRPVVTPLIPDPVSEVEEEPILVRETAPRVTRGEDKAPLDKPLDKVLAKESEWGFSGWETWEKSGVAENREYLFSMRPCDKVSAPADWKDGGLGVTGFIGDKAWGELSDDWESSYWKNKVIKDWNRAQLLYVLKIFFEIEPKVGEDAQWYGMVKDRVSGGDMGGNKDDIRYGLAVYFMELSNRFIPRARHMGLDTMDPRKRKKKGG